MHPRQAYLSYLSTLSISDISSHFSRRVTCLQFHPTLPHTLVSASKSGDISIWNFEQQDNTFGMLTNKPAILRGPGAGSSVVDMKFTKNNNAVIIACVDGHVARVMIGSVVDGSHFGNVNILADTSDHYNWPTSVEILDDNVILWGDVKGKLNIVDMRAPQEEQIGCKIHHGKIQSISFSPLRNQIATASNDHFVRLWDIRNLYLSSSSSSASSLSSNKRGKEKIEPGLLAEFKHEAVVSNCEFSHCSTRLLTTSINSECRIIDLQLPEHVITIKHPHRPFQHLTPIKASWHPVISDFWVIGRYPVEDTAEPADYDKTSILSSSSFAGANRRTIDIYDTHGDLRLQLHDSAHSGIHCLTKFSPTGEYLASGSGQSVLVWKPRKINNSLSLIRKSVEKFARSSRYFPESSNKKTKT